MHKTAASIILVYLVPTVETRQTAKNSVLCPDAYADTWHVLASLIQQQLYS